MPEYNDEVLVISTMNRLRAHCKRLRASGIRLEDIGRDYATILSEGLLTDDARVIGDNHKAISGKLMTEGDLKGIMALLGAIGDEIKHGDNAVNHAIAMKAIIQPVHVSDEG